MGFFDADLPTDPLDFSSPTVAQPLLLQASPIEDVLFAVAARPVEGLGLGTVEAVACMLAERFRIRLTDCVPGRVGGLLRWHDAILARGVQDASPDGSREARVMRLVVLEDGGMLFTLHAVAPLRLEEDWLSTLHHCIETFEIDDPLGPTLPLRADGEPARVTAIEHDPDLPPPKDANEVYRRQMTTKREAALREAAPLIAADRFDEAERLVLAADSSIMGHVALGAAYTDALRIAAAARDRNEADDALRRRAETLYRRALRWRLGCYPDPHTADEAESYEAGQASDREELVVLLGYEPLPR